MPRHWTEKHPDPVDTGIVQEYGTGGGYIYDLVAPTVRVPSQGFQYAYREFGPHIAQDVDTRMAPDGPANRVRSPGVTFLDGVTHRHGLKESIGDNEMEESPNPAADEASMWEYLMQKLRLGLETELKVGLNAATNQTTLTGALQWNHASATIEKSILAAKALFKLQCGFNATHIVVPEDCWDVFIMDPTLRGSTKYTHGNLLDGKGGYSENTFNLQFVVPGGITNTANSGATPSISQLWSDDKVYLMYVDPTVSSSKTAMTAAWFASQHNEVDQRFLARSWRPSEEDMEWTWYQVWEWHKLIIESALIHRLDDVLA